MESSYFDCEREYIEQIRRVAQQNILIQVYCGKRFELYNLVDFYYRSLDQNAILMFLFICAIYPILFMFVAFVSDKYLAVGMQDLSDRFKLSPAIAAVTLIAFANGAPDVLSSLSASGEVGGELNALSSLYGGFIFSGTLVISNVIWNTNKELKLPKLAILKELFFYLISVFVIIAFGFRKKTGYIFIIAYLSVYVIYIFASLAIEKYDYCEDNEDLEEDLEEQGRVEDSDVQDPNKLSVSKSKPFETTIAIEEQDGHMSKTKDQKNILELIVDEVVDEEAGFLVNLIIMPLAITGMFTVSYLENPFIKTPIRYIIFSLSIAWIMINFELADINITSFLAIGFGIGIFFQILELLGVNKNLLEIVIEFISVFATIAWIKIFSDIIIDFITFLAFYFNVHKVILSAILLAAGNTIGDFFGNGALSKSGAAVMAGIASFSGQIFNNFIGFTCSIIGNIKRIN